MSGKRLSREESQQQTRRQLLQVAEELFANKGFHQTSVDQIAKKAGYSKGAVYSNFGSKDDLFLAVFSDNQKKDIEQLQKLADVCHSLDDFVRLIEKNHEQERRTHEDWSMLKLEFLLHALRNEDVRPKLAEIMKESRTKIANILANFYYSESDEILSIEKITFLLLALDIGIGVQSYIDEKSIPNNIYAEGLQAFLRN